MSSKKPAERIFISLLFAFSLFVAAESCGAEQPRRASLSVKDETTRTRDKAEAVDEKSNFTATTMSDIKTEICSLEIEVSDPAEQGGSYELEWYFISKRTSPKGDEELVFLNSEKTPIILEGGASLVKTAVSKPFVFTVKDIISVAKVSNTGTGNSRQIRSGDVYAGYIVLVKAGGEILDQQSNTDRFLNDEWLAKCEAAVSEKSAPKKKKK